MTPSAGESVKLCFVGNSHLAALRGGAKKSSIDEIRSADWFAVGGEMLTIQNGRLEPPPDGRRPVHTNVAGAAEHGLELANYSTVVVSAVGLLAIRNASTSGHPMRRLRLSSWPVGNDLEVASEAVLVERIWNRIVGGSFAKSVRSLVAIFPGKVFIYPTPVASETVLGDAEWDLARWYGGGIRQVMSDYWRCQWLAIQRFVDELGDRAHLVPHPVPGWLDDGFSPTAYSSKDPWHLNKEYGHLALKALADLF
ncbi:MAG: hypothetical protein H0X27_02435 [Caulobacteraceae bacterium]|nr:hypothetical protein [Caulobacteraceae bacterium]